MVSESEMAETCRLYLVQQTMKFSATSGAQLVTYFEVPIAGQRAEGGCTR